MKIAKIAIALLAAALIIAGTFLVSGKLAHPFSPNFVTDQIAGNSNNSSDVRTIENASENLPLPISEDDLRNFSDVKGLPALARADAETEAFVESLQSIRKVKDSLSYDIDLIWYPEYNYKKLYNDVTAELSALTPENNFSFSGSKASELNSFLIGKTGNVFIESHEIIADEPVKLPSGVHLHGNKAKVVFGGSDRAIEVVDAENISVDDFVIEDARFRYGIFVNRVHHFSITGNEISNISERAMCLLNECHTFSVSDNYIHHNALGGIFANGETHHGIFEANRICYNEGSSNATPALFIGQHYLVDDHYAITEYHETDQTELVHSGHDLVIIENDFSHNRAQGFYSYSGWCNYIVNNTISYNQKEGTCLDFGTSLCYVSNNSYIGNGTRDNVDDGEPPYNKLPGISLDNACYNIISANVFARNSGSGIKTVRSSCRNVIVDNAVENNNRGVSENGHFFGIELTSDLKPDYEGAKGLDFAPDYENIVTGNTVTGTHFSAIFIDRDDAYNDVFNNIVTGATNFSIEIHSSKPNLFENNLEDISELRLGN